MIIRIQNAADINEAYRIEAAPDSILRDIIECAIANVDQRMARNLKHVLQKKRTRMIYGAEKTLLDASLQEIKMEMPGYLTYQSPVCIANNDVNDIHPYYHIDIYEEKN